jgi:hypothetical protein
VVSPWSIRKEDKSDFNDLIQIDGPDSVRARIRMTLTLREYMSRRLPVVEARKILEGVTQDFIEAAFAFDPDHGIAHPVHGARIDCGAGKSRLARDKAACMLRMMRGKCDRRSIAIAVPSRKLAMEQAANFGEEHGSEFTVRCWHGIEADDPEAPGNKMCRNLDAIRDADTMGVERQTAACRREMPDGTFETCTFHGMCGYQLQRQQQADLWIVVHELIFTQKPAAIGALAALVVDEAAWPAGLQGAGLDGVPGSPSLLSLDALADPVTVPGDRLATQDLSFLRQLIQDALRALSNGPIPPIGDAKRPVSPWSVRSRRKGWNGAARLTRTCTPA